MKRKPKLCCALLFILALFCFLLSELYFFLNPMFDTFDFIGLYLGPILLYLLSIAATVGLYRIDHACARRLIFALACIICAVTLGVNIWIFTEDLSIAVIYYPYNLSLWFSIPLLISSVLTTCLACRKNMGERPRFCCALLFVVALYCFLLGTQSFFTCFRAGLDFPGWYIGPLLLCSVSVAATVGLYRIDHACAGRLLNILACIICAVTIGVIVWAFAADSSLIAGWYSDDLPLLPFIPLLVFSVLTGILACRRKR